MTNSFYPGYCNASAITPIEQAYIDNPAGQLGPWLAGALASWGLQGVALAQVVTYQELYHGRDNMWTFCWVYGVTVLNFLKSAQTFAIIWDKFIIHFGDWAAVTESASWPQYTEPMMSQTIGFAVQAYFIVRVSRLLPGSWILVTILVLCALTGVGGAIGLTVLISHIQTAAAQATFSTTVIISLVGALACDIGITGSIFWHLLRHKTGFQATDSLINRLVRITWQSALPPSICALLNMATYLGTSDRNYVFIFFNMALSYLYSISMMYTINSRSALRNELTNSSATNRTGAARTTGSVPHWGAISVKGNETFALQSRDQYGVPVKINTHTIVQTHVSPEDPISSKQVEAIAKVSRSSSDSDPAGWGYKAALKSPT